MPERPDAVPLPAVRGEVTFDRVDFAYHDSAPVLHEVSFTAAPGDVVAIVGATGAGKSSLVGLIPRFVDPTAGRVLVDGHDVRTVSLASLRDQVAVVLQEPFLFPVSVAENIALGPARRHARGRSNAPPRRPTPTPSSPRCRRATTRCSANAARRCRAASASASPSRGRC